MIDLEMSEYALYPSSGVAESWHAAGVESSAVHEPAHTGVDAALAAPDEGNGLSPSPIQELDLRLLPAPEPMLRALRAVDGLEAGQTLTLLTPMLPVPLLEELSRRGLVFHTQPLCDGAAKVTVRLRGDDRAA